MTKGERILAAYLTAFLLGIVSVSFGAGLLVGGVYKGRTLRVERDTARAEVVRLREMLYGPSGLAVPECPPKEICSSTSAGELGLRSVPERWPSGSTLLSPSRGSDRGAP